MKNFASFDIEYFEKTDPIIWDKSILQMGYDSPYHNYNNISYHLSTNKNKNLSCIFFNKKIPMILLPLSIFKKNLIFPDKPCPIFLINKIYNNKSLINFTLSYIKKILIQNKLKNYIFSDHPYTKYPTNKMNFQNIKVKNIEKVNRLILDLKLPRNQLLQNLSKSLRKTINKSEKYYNFKVIDKSYPGKDILRYMNNLKMSHFLVSKRKTRSDLSWKLMTDFIKQNNGILFLLKYKNKIVSYLYCGIYKNYVWGWTQVNTPQENLKVSFKFEPRHILEWKVINYLKEANFTQYDLGDSYLDFKKYSKKVLSISLFKRKFGPDEFNKNLYYL